MRTRFSIDVLTEFERLTDEIKIAARDIARKFCPNIPLYEPWMFDLYVGDTYVTIKWCGRCDCDDEEFDVRYEWFGMTDEELDELVMEEQRRKERHTYCNIIRDYGKLREIAAKIINALDIKDEEADEVTQYDIRSLHVDDSHTTINIEWIEVFDGERECQFTREHVETVPAEWFALDESNLRNVVKSYKKQMKELIEGLKKDLDTAEENRRDADNRIAEIKRRLSNLEGY